MHAHTMYSDDHGISWSLGQASLAGVTECQVTELQNGDLFMTMRQEKDSIKYRQVALSKDGGYSWKDQRTESALVDAGCQGSILYFNTGEHPMLLLANVVSEKYRENICITASFDHGLSWSNPYSFHPGPAAYSDLLVLDEGHIACCYEHGFIWPYQGLKFEKLPISGFMQ